MGFFFLFLLLVVLCLRSPSRDEVTQSLVASLDDHPSHVGQVNGEQVEGS